MRFIARKHWGESGREPRVPERKDGVKDPRPPRGGAKDARDDAAESSDADADAIRSEDFQPRWWPVLDD
jgi:hypothetical protein